MEFLVAGEHPFVLRLSVGTHDRAGELEAFGGHKSRPAYG